MSMNQKTRKFLKTASFLAAAALIIGLGVFANALVGNPVSKLLASRTAKAHLAEHYAGTDFYIEEVGYNFKDGNYYVHVKSPTSQDSSFALYVTMSGRLKMDTYEYQVLRGENTARRLGKAYRDLTDTVLESPSFPFESDIGFGDLAFISREWVGMDSVPAYALIEEELILDQVYDLQELGAMAGHLVLYVQDETVTVERAAKIMVEVKQLMDAGGVPFYAMDFVLQPPRSEDGPWSDEQIGVREFLSSDIYEEGMEERVRAAHEALMAYYAEEDAKAAKMVGEAIDN